MHWAELDFSEEVLRSIPKALTESDASIRTLFDLLIALRKAVNGVSVFPLNVPFSVWWSPSPHTDLPPTWNRQRLQAWIPARVDIVDHEGSQALLTVGEPPESVGGEPICRDLPLSKETVVQSAHGFEWEDLSEGRHIELGYYGPDRKLRIGFHRDTEWRDPNLLPLVPPPDRWYKRAVEKAWNSMGSGE